MELKVWALGTFLMLGSAVADEPQPSPVSASSPTSTPSPAVTATPVIVLQSIESPLPDGSPEQQRPTILLPEPNFLPPPQVKLVPGNEAPLGDTPGESKPDPRDESRFQELKSTAMGSARANYLLNEAKTALSDEARKNFMRAYYYTVCAQMRRLDPRLKSMIQNYETEEIQKLGSDTNSQVTKKKATHAKGSSGSRVASSKKRHHHNSE